MQEILDGIIQTSVTWVQENALSVVLALLILIFGRWIARLITSGVKKLMLKAKMEDILVNFIAAIVRATLMLFVFIAALSQIGVDTTSLVALIGAAGIAVGLALKDSLQNFASGVLLIIFRPFKTGNFVEAGGVSGIVDRINIFSTTLKTVDNKEVTVPNGNIYSGVITNYSARDTRRVDMTIGISYDSDLLRAKSILHRLLAEDDRILPEPEPVIAVSELADSSVNIVVRPWVKSADYWAVLTETQERIKLKFDEEGIVIPYPQMDIHMRQVKS